MTEAKAAGTTFPWLERVTAAALVLTLLVLGWMVVAAFLPGAARLASTEVEVLTVLGLLLLALVLVSLIALLHTG